MNRQEEMWNGIDVNRQYKDRLFKLVYMGMINDISFLVYDVLNLYEHQSTFNPNMPLRGMLYFARLYQRIVGDDKRIYGSRRIDLPFPQFIVFYNGTQDEAERVELKLSDSFPEWSRKEKAALECKAIVLNINLGYNKEVMEKCRKLREYAQYVALVRKYIKEGLGIEKAVDRATDDCIREGILEQILRNNRTEVRSMLLTEYNEQEHIKYEKELSYEEGVEEGKRIGEICAMVRIWKKIGKNRESLVAVLQDEFSVPEAEAQGYIEEYWE